MAHLSTPSAPWGKPFTNKRYLHPPYAENLVIMWPTSMVTIGDIRADMPHKWTETKDFGRGFACPDDSAGVVFTLRRESDMLMRKCDKKQGVVYDFGVWQGELMPAEATKYATRRDGVPIHSLKKDLDAISFYEEAFCDTARVPTAYIKVTLENNLGFEQTLTLTAVTRSGPEFLLTGCLDPDGYHGYTPSMTKLNADEMTRFKKEGDILTDGRYKLYFEGRAGFEMGAEGDLSVKLTLAPYEKKTFTFVLTRSESAPKKYSVARRESEEFWKNELGKANFVPDRKGIEPLVSNFLAQLLQMFACPVGERHAIMRQGATQRFHWPEAKEIILALSHIGGYSSYIDRALSYYFDVLQEKEGENRGRIFYNHVPWNSRAAAALEMLSYASDDDESFFNKYADDAIEAFRWMERERAKSAHIEGAVAGIFPPGVATDNSYGKAQQWTFADTAMLRGYKLFSELLCKKGDPRYPEVKAAYDDYFGVMKAIFDGFADEQRDSDTLIIPRDPKNDPELEAGLNTDSFFYMFPNSLLSSGIAGYGTSEANKIIYTYSRDGQTKNGLIYPAYASTTGTGRTWYTTWAEHDRFRYYENSGESEKCRELLEALLRYNVTTEFYQCERYDDHNAYIAPWMPNASANGRLLDMLFSYHGAKKIRK